jgi:hypothetical protein
MVFLLHSGVSVPEMAVASGLHVKNVYACALWLHGRGLVTRAKRAGVYVYYGTQASERYVMGEVARVEGEAMAMLEAMLLNPLCKRDRVLGLLGR